MAIAFAAFIPWLIFAGCVLAIILGNLIIVRYYLEPNKASKYDEPTGRFFPVAVTVLGLSVSIFCVFLIPVDIYSVSNQFSVSERQDLGNIIKVVYYVLYSFVFAFIFAIIPFSYFYYEASGEDATFGSKVWAGCKYTVFAVFIVAVIFIIGLFVQGGSPNGTDYASYVQNVLDSENKGDSAVTFALACATGLGFIIWCTYTAYGLSAFPIGWIKGKRSLEEEEEELETQLLVTTEKRRAISSKYLDDDDVNRKDEERLRLLRRKEREYQHKRDKLEEAKNCCNKCWTAFRPFKFLIGILFLLVTLVIMVSFILTSIDKIINSSCGFSCGYTLTQPTQWLNPIDTFLTYMAQWFPLDYVLLGLLVSYFYFATIDGIIHIGVRFLWMLLYRIRAGASKPQGLLIATCFIMFSLLALNLEIMGLAPQYIAYGSQTYTDANGNTARCNLSVSVSNCTMTQIGTIVNRISMKLSFFGVFFYFATWVFIICFFIGAVIAIFKSRQSNVEELGSDDDLDF